MITVSCKHSLGPDHMSRAGSVSRAALCLIYNKSVELGDAVASLLVCSSPERAVRETFCCVLGQDA